MGDRGGSAADSLAPRRGTERLKEKIQGKTLKHPEDLEIEHRAKCFYPFIEYRSYYIVAKGK